MLKEHIAARGIHDPRVLEAMRTVPRHHFVAEANQGHAYEDHPIKIDCGQTISQPYIVALMTDLLELDSNDRVLEIGTGSGYQTAILAHLAKEVISIERHAALAQKAAARLAALGYTNAAIHQGDGSLGAPHQAPFDAIMVTAATPKIPHALTQQLREGGRLVCPTGSRKRQRLLKITRQEGGLANEDSIECVFVPLIGQDGWPEDKERS